MDGMRLLDQLAKTACTRRDEKPQFDIAEKVMRSVRRPTADCGAVARAFVRPASVAAAL